MIFPSTYAKAHSYFFIMQRVKRTKFVELSGVNVVYNAGSNSQNVQLSGMGNSNPELPPQTNPTGVPDISSNIEPELPAEPDQLVKIEWPQSLYVCVSRENGTYLTVTNGGTIGTAHGTLYICRWHINPRVDQNPFFEGQVPGRGYRP